MPAKDLPPPAKPNEDPPVEPPPVDGTNPTRLFYELNFYSNKVDPDAAMAEAKANCPEGWTVTSVTFSQWESRDHRKANGPPTASRSFVVTMKVTADRAT